ncbi:MAG TPA: filamentous hemagglutinin family protein [Alphaproteobacteria bacterium]|nr:filamentous hemagglutinin family protein [Alphaproteobacteria bacterium]
MGTKRKDLMGDRRTALQIGVSATALLLSGALTQAYAADAAFQLSPAGLAQAAQRTGTIKTTTPQTSPLTSPAVRAQIALSTANLARASQALKNIAAAQTAASAASQLTLNNAPLSGSAWNGKALSGLNPVNDKDPGLWINANPIKKNTKTATATIKQTAAKALLTWQSLDLNKGETLNFDQQGHADWVVLNRIVAGPRGADGSRFIASPSYILGAIKAPGTVYVINPNGVIFGPNSQVNVHSLIASTLDVGDAAMTLAERNSFFLNQGITSVTGQHTSFAYNQDDNVVEGDVVVDAGATISTSLAPRTVSPDSGGYVYLIAPNVENDGTISTPAGEILMLAAQQVQLVANAYPAGGIGGVTPTGITTESTFRAVGPNMQLNPSNAAEIDPWRTDGNKGAEISTPGRVTNTGMLNAERGVVILNGDEVTNGALFDSTGAATQVGVIRADTSITRNSQIFLDARLKLTLSGGSSIQIMPDENGETIPQSALSSASSDSPSFVPGSIEMSGNTVDIESGGLIIAPGGNVAINGMPGTANVTNPVAYPKTVQSIVNRETRELSRIYMAPDSAIDVSGLDGVTLSQSGNLITFQPFGNEFADQPLQRQGALRGQKLTVDIRAVGTLNGIPWVGTPLANVSKLAANVPLTIDQLLTTGGNVSLSSSQADEIVLRQGSTINVSGGYVSYTGGYVATSNLLTADGRIVNIANADPLLTYTGVAGVSVSEHPHWGATTTQTFVNPLLSQGVYQPGYVEGHDAGGITLGNPIQASTYVLDGRFYAGVVVGQRQAALGQRPDPTTANTDVATPTAMPSAGYLNLYGANNLIIAQNVAALADSFSVNSKLTDSYVATTQISAASLSLADFGQISAKFTGSLVVKQDATLEVTPGGSIELVAGSADIQGDLTARSGSITIETTSTLGGNALVDVTDPTPPGIFSLTVGPHAVLDTSGLWVNDTGADLNSEVGGAYVNGGSITLKTDTATVPCVSTACTSLPGLGTNAFVDTTANIVLDQGSHLDLASGGRVGLTGQLQTDSSGRPVGTGGNLTLQTYATGFNAAGGLAPTTTPATAAILFQGSDGTAQGNVDAFNAIVSAYGFAKGGTLSVRTPTVQIVSDGSTPISAGATVLPGSFFKGGAFSNYVLEGIGGGVSVAADTHVVLRQRNLLADSALLDLATGADPAAVTKVGYLPEIARAPTNLSLSGSLAPLPETPYAPPPDLTPLPPAVALSIGAGAVIAGDPGAAINIAVAGRNQLTLVNDGSQVGDVAAQNGVADIEGTIRAPSGSITVSAGTNSEIWLGATSNLDASGVAVTDTRQTAYNSGEVLAGGTVTVVAQDVSSSVVAVAGSRIDVSGASGVFDIPKDNPKGGLPAPIYAPTKLWSDAGSVTLSASTLLYDGRIVAQPGAREANGGSLMVSLPSNSGVLTVRDHGRAVPDGLTPTSALTDFSREAIFQADHLKDSGIANLTLSAGTTTGALSPDTVEFDGNVSINGLNSLTIDASTISVAAHGAPTDPSGCNVCLSANYVAIQGAGNGDATRGNGVLTVKADMIDLNAGGNSGNVLAVSGVSQANFISATDIRLGQALPNLPSTTDPGSPVSGELVTRGDLTLKAAQIYPISDMDFTLKSLLADGTITFEGNGTAAWAPLSAGGQVTVDAANIVQKGTLRAPLGTIRLGVKTSADLSPNDTSGQFIVTKSVKLAAGSITSVSLSGLTVPFGQTSDGKNWSYDSNVGLPLTQAPQKTIQISGDKVDLAAKATVDLSGGGDIQAMEFVEGTGGTRDVLAEPNVYAIIPGYNPKAAPVDLNFVTDQGDTVPMAGSAVYLSGSPGLPAGYYTLLPAHYATLPGAYRVEVVANSQNARVSQNTVLPDGTAQVAGYMANTLAGTRSAQTMTFDVQSSAVWRQYSEIDQTSGNAYFGSLAQATGSAARLPKDSGHIVINANSALNLAATIASAPAAGGRGAELDITGTRLQIVSSGASAANGFLGLDASQLSGLSVDSLLVGGYRIDGAAGETIKVTAETVEVSNDASSPLTAPQIILVAQGSSSSGANTGTVKLDAGSVIRAKGTLAATDPTDLVIGTTTSRDSGNGAFLSLSTGAPITVTRANGDPTIGRVTMAAGVTLAGASLTADSGNISIGVGSNFDVGDITLDAAAVGFGDAPTGQSGLVLNEAVLASLGQATSLNIRSLGAATFYGDVAVTLSRRDSTFSLDANAIASSGGGTVTLAANTVQLVNSGPAAGGAVATGTGDLQINAAQIVLGAGDKLLSGFARADLTASQQVVLSDSGSLSAGAAALNFNTPRMLVGQGAIQAVTTTGAATIQGSGAVGSPISGGGIGGTFVLKAGTISDDSLIQATAGGVTLEASTGDVALGDNARIAANGYAQTFFDVTRVAGGGAVQLIADSADITIAKGASIDISSASGYQGYAGSLALVAGSGVISSNGGAFDSRTIAGTAGDSGGRLVIDAKSIGADSLAVPSIFTDTVDVHIRQGNFQVASAISAQNVTITADTGTLTVASTIDASGTSGGAISLFGGQGVTMTADGKLVATASDKTKRGGDVVIGTEVAADNGSSHDGVIDLAAGSIDVSNTANADNGGTVRLRAPLIRGGADVAINTIKTTITGASSVTVEAFKVFEAGKGGFTGTIDPAGQSGFYGSCTAQGVCSGTLVDFVQRFKLSAASQAKFAGISSEVLHLQPGIELVNNDLGVNNGDITVASNWNLGAGTAGFLVNATAFTAGGKTIAAGTVITDKNGVLLPQYAGYTDGLAFVSGVSQITSMAYRVGGSPTGEAGTLTLRAARDVVFDASITDGFFQTANRLDPTYIRQVTKWVARATARGANTNANNVGGYIVVAENGRGAPPIAPYVAGANAISPVGTASDPAPITGADLFPLVSDPNGTIVGTDGNYSAIGSWSYRVAAGADTASADPLAVRPLAVFADGGSGALSGHGNVIIENHTTLTIDNLNSDGLPVRMQIPTTIRTGTGSIDIAAARDFILADQDAPGVVYTAGRNSVALPDPNYQMQTVADPLNPGRTITIPVPVNPEGFQAPRLLACDAGSAFNCNPYGPITQAAYPVDAGHLTVTAGQDIQGYQPTKIRAGDGSGLQPNQQFFAPWLIAQGTSLTDTEYGVFSVLSGYVSNDGPIFIPSQTSWWLNFGSFDQGLMSVGGDVRVVAGRDISQLSVSLPTTARVSGGLTSTITDKNGNVTANVPVMHLNASGDLTVIAGRNIDSGAFYEGSGKATITAGGSVQAGWTTRNDPTDPSSPQVPVSTVLAVDTGSITLRARGSIDIAGVVSAVSLQNVADASGANNSNITSAYLSSYGPQSAVTLLSVAGDVVTNSLANGKILIENEPVANGISNVSNYRGVSAYPASFEAASLSGDVTVANALRLAPSETGTLTLLAYGSLVTQSANNYQQDGFSDFADAFQALSTGPSIVEAAFEAEQPLAGFGPTVGSQVLDLGPHLLHTGDTTPDRFYAATGDIQSGAGVSALDTTTPQTEFPLSWEVTKAAIVHAGQDIVDLPFFGQNLNVSDVTQIIAGRDIYYTGALSLVAGVYPSRPVLDQPENAAGLSLGGPGYFDVEAGRNLGPFVTAVADQAAVIAGGGPDATGTGIITFGNTVTVGNRLMITGHDAARTRLNDQFATGANFLLPRRGASIVALFGVGKGIDYNAVIKADIDPATATSSHNYGADLVTFLQTLGLPARNATQAWATFQGLKPPLQHIFVEQVFFSELASAGANKNFAGGYNTVGTLFPVSYGYTNNGTDGAALVSQVQTGDLEMLHATIKTLQATTIQTTDPSTGSDSSVAVGGDVTILGPGGNVTVGSQAVEINPFLTPSALGILTLDNGKINTFTDGGLIVNESRVLTVQGGDMVLWSSNGDLDAGRGAKTSVDFKPLSVIFDNNDLQTIDLNGLVSGAGIGTIQSTPDAPAASASLIAPRGTVNAGDAGLRSSGDLNIIALRVLNAANIASLGAVSGVPQANSVNLGALESASGTAGSSAQVAQNAVADAANRGNQTMARKISSQVNVDVLGFGDCDPEAGKKCPE